MPTIEEQRTALAELSLRELAAIQGDNAVPRAVRDAAGDIELALRREQLARNWKSFTAATPEFARLTGLLMAVTDKAAQNPVSDALRNVNARINGILRRMGQMASQELEGAFDDALGIAEDGPPAGAAAASSAIPEATPQIPENPAATDGESMAAEAIAAAPIRAAPMMTALPSPHGPAVVIDARDLPTLAAEYNALFTSAVIRPERRDAVERLARALIASRRIYAGAGDPLGVPWHVVAVIHAMERLNFGCHLHNGDPLSARTVNEPRNRPAVGEPPYTWSASAADALVGHGFDKVGAANWTVPRTLFKLEQYNGFGYRRFHQATPYLWSFCQHYDVGKFVADGRYDPRAVSRQCGAAVLLEHLQATGAISIPD